MNEIKIFLLISNVTEIERKKNNYIESAYEIRTVRRESCSILINYLNNFPLFSSPLASFLIKMKQGST
jgi:type IV secretory pathway VirB4 component